MPANLPPQYFETEKKLKTAKTPQEKIAVLEELLAIVPKHKGTEKLQALLKTKIAKFKSLATKRPAMAKHGPTFHIDKAGAGQIILVGKPNAGKSMLIRALTNATPEVADYPFTTHTPSPAMMRYEKIQIQLIDTAPITPDYFEAWQAEMIKVADGVLLVLDASSDHILDDYQTLLDRLREKKIELSASPPDKASQEYVMRKKTLIIGNKIDLPSAKENVRVLKEILPPESKIMAVSAEQGDNLEELKTVIFHLLEVLRVYSKIPGKKVDVDDPFIFPKGSSVLDMAKAVHKDFAVKLRYARIWNSDKHQGQKVNRDYELRDEDIIELHI